MRTAEGSWGLSRAFRQAEKNGVGSSTKMSRINYTWNGKGGGGSSKMTPKTT